MMVTDEGDELRVDVPGGELVGRVSGRGQPLLLLHGGPVSQYLEPLADELGDNYRVATYQQRGLEPSTLSGPYDVATHVADVLAVMDDLGWERPLVAGHSWGGNLLLHLLAAQPARVRGALVVDPLGGVGDGGYAEFDEEMQRRTRPAERERATALDQKVMEGVATPEEAVESMRIFWPAYFPSPEQAPPFPGLRINATSAGATLESALAETPALADRLRGCTVPVIFVHGESSPMPVTASTDTAAAIGPAARVIVVPGAGHFLWLDRPGCLRDPLDELVRATASAEPVD